MSPTHPMFPGEPPLASPTLNQRAKTMTDVADHIAAYICRTIGPAYAARPDITVSSLAGAGITTAGVAHAACARGDADATMEALVAVAQIAIEGAWRADMETQFVADRVEHVATAIGTAVSDHILTQPRTGISAVLGLLEDAAPYPAIAAVALDTAAASVGWPRTLAAFYCAGGDREAFEAWAEAQRAGKSSIATAGASR